MSRVRIGAHLRAPGGLAKGGLPYAEEVGAEAVQVFTANPRQWAQPAGDPEQDAAFRDWCADHGVPVYIHAPYLINLGSPSPQTRRLSVESLRHALDRGRAIGALGVVVHAGSAVGGERYEDAMAQVREDLLPLLDSQQGRRRAAGPRLLVEPTAGGGQALAATVPALGAYLDALDRHPMVGVCLDVCHVFAAGHDVAARGGMKRTLDELVSLVGAGRLRLVHANDSRDACGSRRDRHAGIGHGQIGETPFRALLRHPAVDGVPLIVETPGGAEGHARDIVTLKRLRAAG